MNRSTLHNCLPMRRELHYGYMVIGIIVKPVIVVCQEIISWSLTPLRRLLFMRQGARLIAHEGSRCSNLSDREVK